MPEMPVYARVSWYTSVVPKSKRKTLSMPVRFDMKASDRPSGAHTGLVFLPSSMCGSTWIESPSSQYRAMRRLPKRSDAKSVDGPRSVVKAMVRPSGDHCGRMSA